MARTCNAVPVSARRRRAARARCGSHFVPHMTRAVAVRTRTFVWVMTKLPRSAILTVSASAPQVRQASVDGWHLVIALHAARILIVQQRLVLELPVWFAMIAKTRLVVQDVSRHQPGNCPTEEPKYAESQTMQDFYMRIGDVSAPNRDRHGNTMHAFAHHLRRQVFVPEGRATGGTSRHWLTRQCPGVSGRSRDTSSLQPRSAVRSTSLVRLVVGNLVRLVNLLTPRDLLIRIRIGGHFEP